MLMSLNRPHPATMSSVTSVLDMDRTTLTAALKPLQRRGLIEVLTDPKDARSRLLKLTQDGLLTLKRALPIWTATHEEIDKALGEGGSDALREGMARIR